MKKIFTWMAVVLLGATSVKAQNPDGLSWAVEAGVGTEFEVGGRAQYKLHDYVAWDVLNLKYAYDYGKYSANEISLTTGLRGFSPTFAQDMRLFAGLDVGYGNRFKDGHSVNCFAMDLTLGVYLTKNLYAGYGFGMLANEGTHKDHLFRIGYNF